MAITAENRYLTRAEMEGNAEVIASVLTSHGWTLNAIAAMLGNMESESTINPAIYENLDDTSTDNGFGLVQWTPNTKYKEWCDMMGYTDYNDIYHQLERIRFELYTGLQWIPTDAFPMSFAEFAASEASPELLAQAFLYNYERPADLNQASRSLQAREWYNYLSSTVIDPPTPPKKKGEMSKLLLYWSAIRR